MFIQSDPIYLHSALIHICSVVIFSFCCFRGSLCVVTQCVFHVALVLFEILIPAFLIAQAASLQFRRFAILQAVAILQFRYLRFAIYRLLPFCNLDACILQFIGCVLQFRRSLLRFIDACFCNFTGSTILQFIDPCFTQFCRLLPFCNLDACILQLYRLLFCNLDACVLQFYRLLPFCNL